MAVKTTESGKVRKGKRKVRAVLDVLLLLTLLATFFVLGGRALCKIAIDQIAELTNTKIRTQSVKFNFNCSVVIKGLVIRPEHERKDEEAIVSGEKIDDAILKAETVYARFGIPSLLRFKPRLRKISVKDFVFDAQNNVDEAKWNVAALKITPPKDGAAEIPLVRLKRGTLQHSEVVNNKRNIIAEIPVDAYFGPPRVKQAKQETKTDYEFNITTADMYTSGGSTLRGTWRPGRILVRGAISSTDVPEFQKVCSIGSLFAVLDYTPDHSYSLDLELSDLVTKLKSPTETITFYTPVSSRTSGPFSAFEAFLDRYTPSGQMDITLKANGNLNELRDSKIAGQVQCKDVSIRDRKFPYAVEHLTGKIDFTNSEAALHNLRGEHGDVTLFINGWTKGYGPDWQYEVRVTSDNMALDDDLYDALNEKRRKLWQVSPPSKDSIVAIDHLRVGKGSDYRKETLSVELRDAKTVFKHFPYPLTNLSGKLLFEHDTITVSDLVSKCRGWDIKLNGEVTNCYAEKPAYDVSIQIENIPWDFILNPPKPLPADPQADPNTGDRQEIEEVFAHLPSSAKEIVSEIHPKGNINLTIDFDATDPNTAPDYTVTLNCLKNTVKCKLFPYPLKDIEGTITLTKNNVTVRDITAVAYNGSGLAHDSTIKVNGTIDLVEGAFDKGNFQIEADNIFLNSQLEDALPEKIRQMYSRLSPSGKFDLNCKSIRVTKTQAGKKRFDFDAALTLEDCSLNVPVPITGLNATLRTKTHYITEQGLADTIISIKADSVTILDAPFNDVTSDISYSGAGKTWAGKNLMAQCCGGKVVGEFELKTPPGKPSVYLLDAAFNNVDLKQFLARANPNRENGYTSGNAAGSFCVTGRPTEPASRLGHCRVTVTDMKVGKLSPLAKLLSVLRLDEPADFAFDRMFVDSYIRGDNLFLDCFDLAGPSVAFKGSGYMSLPGRNISLILTARGKRLATAEPSLLQSLTEDLSQAVIRVEVTGRVHDPQVTTETLPVIRDAFGILGKKQPESM